MIGILAIKMIWFGGYNMKYNLTLKHFLKFTTNFLIVLYNQVSVTLNKLPTLLPLFLTLSLLQLSGHLADT